MGVHRRTKAIGVGLAACCAWAITASAQPNFEDPPAHSSVSLISETTGISPDTTTKIAFVFEIDKGWHTYADALNDTGSPLLITWAAPDGIEIGEPIWPASHRYIQPGDILDHVYEDSLVLTLPVSADAGLEHGTDAVISASLEWLVCDDTLCVPQYGEVSISLPVTSSPVESENAAIIRKARRESGKLLTGARTDPIMVDWRDETLVLTNLAGYAMSFIPGPGCAEPVELLKRGQSDSGTLELLFDFDESEKQVVEGWVRLTQIEGKNAIPVDETLYRVHLRKGKKPTLILGE